MFDQELSPPPSGRLSSSSGTPDSIYKSSTNSSHSESQTLNFSPDTSRTSTAYKAPTKFLTNEDYENEWDPSLASPVQKRPPSLRKLHRYRSRVNGDNTFASPIFSDRENIRPLTLTSPVTTPPHKRLRALHLSSDAHRNTSANTSANTSKYSNMMASPDPRAPQFQSPSPSLRSRHASPRTSLFSSGGGSSAKKMRAARSPAALKRPLTNPFTPSRYLKLHRISDSGFSEDSWQMDSDMDGGPSEFRLSLEDMATYRYKEEFCEECILGSGEFGTVYKCINKLDGVTYAIKKSREPVANTVWERIGRNEVFAHSVLENHPNIVRYYSGWAEDGHLYIQNEFCNGNNLAEEIATHQKRGTKFTEAELKDILRQVSHGLRYVHSEELAHMDVKPGNIFIHYNQKVFQSPESGIEEDFCNHDYETSLNDRVTYKVGDFGHVTSLRAREVEEGDCRYLPKEILNDDYSSLAKADIFALGLIVYQAALLIDLPKNGEQWHDIRDGKLVYLSGYSNTINNLVKQMLHPDPVMRPSSTCLACNTELCPAALRSRIELTKELNEERYKNKLLVRQLKAVQERVEKAAVFGLAPLNNLRPTTRANRLVGTKVNRSKSLTNF